MSRVLKVLDEILYKYEGIPSQGFDEGGRVGFASGTPFPVNDETIEKFRYYIEETDLDKKAIGEKLGFKSTAKGVGGNIRKDSPIVKAYEAKYGKIPVDRFKEYRLNVKEGVGKRIVQAYDKQLKNFGKANISQIVKDVYGPGKKDFDGTRKNVRAFLSEVRGYEGKTNIPVGDENLSKEDLKSKARKKKLKLIDDTAIGKFMAGPKDSGLQYHHMDATKSSMVTLNNLVYAPSEVNNFIQKYEGPITQRKKEIAKLNKDKPKGYKKKIDTKLNQIRNTIAKADMDLKKGGYSAFQGIIEVDTVDVNGKPIKIGGNTALKLGEGVIEELGLNPNKPLKQFTSEERIKLNEAKKALVKKSKINISKQPSAMKELMSRTSMGIDPTLLPKAAYEELVKPAAKFAGKAVNVGLGPTGLIGLNAALGVDPTQAMDRIGIAGEAALAKPLVQGSLSVTDKIKTPLLRKIAERASLAGMSPAMALRAARIASPLGLASIGIEGLYHLGKAGYNQYKLMQDMSEDERREFLAQQYEDLGGVAGEGA